jgi:hypothetical protein
MPSSGTEPHPLAGQKRPTRVLINAANSCANDSLEQKKLTQTYAQRSIRVRKFGPFFKKIQVGCVGGQIT